MLRIRNIVRYLIVFCLNLLVVIVFHSYVNFVLLVGMILFPLYGIYGVWKIKQHVRVSLRIPFEDMEKGKEFIVDILLDNPTWVPSVNVTLQVGVENIFYGHKGSHSLNVPLRMHGTTEVSYPIVMEQCGRFCFRVEQLHCMDLLGICEVAVPVEEMAECIVLPEKRERNREAGDLYEKGVGESMESKEKGYDFSEISGIREYIPGDKLQNIHWKLSTKNDMLMVKERVSVSAMQLHMVVELRKDEGASLEGVMELANSITDAFVKQNRPFTVHYYSVTRDELQQIYIGDEAERKKWLQLLLYDVSYENECKAKNLFQKEYPGAGQYLYIGSEEDAGETEKLMGEHGAVAILLSGC